MKCEKVFTKAEEKELRRIAEQGGVLLKIYNEPNELVRVLYDDGSGKFKCQETLSTQLGFKVFEIYGSQISIGHRLVTLNSIIDEYC